MDFRRIHAQRQAEVDDAMLRALHDEKARVANKLNAKQQEIEGLERVVAELQDQIAADRGLAAELQRTHHELEMQEREIVADRDRWSRQLA